MPIARAASGFFLGIAGFGTVPPDLLSYALEKTSKHPEKFGTGIIEGVRTEAANNAASKGTFTLLA